jgi:hypothetical protein
VLENGSQTLLDALGCQVGLRLLPGQGMILEDGTGQKQEPHDQCHQPTPAVTGFFVLETRQVPAQALFAKADTRLDGPAMTVSLPDEFSRDVQMLVNVWWRLPG